MITAPNISINGDIMNYPVPIFCKEKAYEATRIARSYYENRGTDEFTDRVFVYDNNNFMNHAGEQYVLEQTGEYAGQGMIDCSTYINLVIRGIDYYKSPFFGATLSTKYDRKNLQPNRAFTWTYDYSHPERDAKGRLVYRFIRYAADQAEYLYNCGRVITDNYDQVEYEYDSEEDRYIWTYSGNARPGDLIFFRPKDGTDNGRFERISHVGILAQSDNAYFNATNSGLTILYSYVKHIDPTDDREIVFIARPFYEQL